MRSRTLSTLAYRSRPRTSNILAAFASRHLHAFRPSCVSLGMRSAQWDKLWLYFGRRGGTVRLSSVCGLCRLDRTKASISRVGTEGMRQADAHDRQEGQAGDAYGIPTSRQSVSRDRSTLTPPGPWRRRQSPGVGLQYWISMRRCDSQAPCGWEGVHGAYCAWVLCRSGG